MALALAARGADVALCYRESRAEAEATAHAVVKLGRRAQLIQADLRAPADCRRAVAETVSALGRLDVLVNMASVYARKPYLELTDDDWERSLAVDLRAAHLCAQAAVPHMRAAGEGRIVNFTDWVAASRRPRYPGYLPVLRGEDGRDRADGSAGARAGGRQHPRQCGSAGSHHPA